MAEKVTGLENTATQNDTDQNGIESSTKEKIAELKGIPTFENLKEILKDNVVVVDFNKLNGDRRVMSCTLDETVIPAIEKSKRDSTTLKKTQENISVWDINANGWRSFRYDRVNQVTIQEVNDEE